jgi:XRE family aerobic/anaerobic benzoate catabolism transcriptional regulator
MHTKHGGDGDVPPRESKALQQLGATIRGLRRGLGLTRAELATRSELSLRFLAQLEAGSGNISYLRLRRVASALGLETAALIERAETSGGRPIALIGMRGAGKSSVGARLAERLDAAFVEADEVIEREAGMPLAQIFELQGEPSYRRLENEALTRLLSRGDRAVIATGGGIVTAPDAFALLRRRAFTIWLKATPREHWNRVLAQGDRRPIADRPDAVADMNRLWAERSPLYAEADLVMETSGKTVEAVVEAILAALNRPEAPEPTGKASSDPHQP